MNLIPRRFQSEAFSLTAIQGPDGPMFAAVEVAVALDYKQTNTVPKKVRQWSDELQEGRDFVVLTGDDARFVVAALTIDESSTVIQNRGSLMVLTKHGLTRFLFRSKAPKARAFRDWVLELLDAIERGDLAPVAPEVHEPQTVSPTAEDVQLQLAQIELERQRLQHQATALEVFRDLRVAGRRVPGFVAEAAGRRPRTPRTEAPPALTGPTVPAPEGAEVPEGWFRSPLYALGLQLNPSKKKSAATALLKRQAKATGLWDDDSWHTTGVDEFVRQGKRGTTTVHLFRDGFLDELRRRRDEQEAAGV